jgi:NAD(P)H-quinone oxidoreductase subunit 5
MGVMDYVPVGLDNEPLHAAGVVALIGMSLMYVEMTAFQLWPQSLVAVRRWVYAGFYMDEGYTYWVLRRWPASWAGADRRAGLRPWGVHESGYASVES